MKYYKTDSRKISYREYFNISRRGFPIAWLCKLLGIPLKLTNGIPEPQPFRQNIIEAGAIPSGILAKLNSGVLDLKQLGFDQFWFYTLKNSLIGGQAYGVQALHSSQKTVGKVKFTSFKSRQSFLFVFISELKDGTVLGTTNNRPQFNSPHGYMVLRQLGASAPQLLELHQNKLSELSHGNPPNLINNFDQVEALEDKTSRMSYEDKIARGVWVEMVGSEVEALRAKLIKS
jgi:hypothetical protein